MVKSIIKIALSDLAEANADWIKAMNSWAEARSPLPREEGRVQAQEAFGRVVEANLAFWVVAATGGGGGGIG
jgi:hypothetical protein